MEVIVLVVKYLVAALFVVVGGYLYIVSKKGRECAYTSAEPYGACLYEHIRYARRAFWITLVAIIVTEVFVRLNGGSSARTLLWVHLAMSVPFVGTLAYTAFKHTGLRYPKTHRYVAYTCLVLYLGTVVTGYAMLFPDIANQIWNMTLMFLFVVKILVAGLTEWLAS